MLRPQRKLHKKEIKEDGLVTWYFRITRWLDKYHKQATTGACVLVALVLIGLLMVQSKRREENKALGKLGIAESAYFMNDGARAIQEMKPIVDKYAGTHAAGTAAFYLADAYYGQGSLAEAEKYFRLYVDKYGDNPFFTASSLAGLAQVAESRNETAKAAELYEKAGSRYSKLATAPFYLKEAARCYIALKKTNAAKKLFESIRKKYPDNPLQEEIQFLEGVI